MENSKKDFWRSAKFVAPQLSNLLRVSQLVAIHNKSISTWSNHCNESGRCKQRVQIAAWTAIVLQRPSGQQVLPHPLGPDHMMRHAARDEFRRWINRSRGFSASGNNWGALHGTANAPPRFGPRPQVESALGLSMPGAAAPLSGALPDFENYTSSFKTSGSGGSGGALHGAVNAPSRFVPRRPVDCGLRQSMPGAGAPLSGPLPEFQSYGRTSASAGNGGPFKARAGAPAGFVAAAAGGSVPLPQIPVSYPFQYAPVPPPWNFSTTGTIFNSESHYESPTGVTSRFVPAARLSSRPGPSVSVQRAPSAQSGSKQRTKGRTEESLHFSIPEVHEVIEIDASSTGSSQDLCETRSYCGSEEREFGTRSIMAQAQGVIDGLTRAAALFSGPLPDFQNYASSGQTSASGGKGGTLHGTRNAPPRFAPRPRVDNALRTSMPEATVPLSEALPEYKNYASSGKISASRGNGGTRQFTSEGRRGGATGVPSCPVPEPALGSPRGPYVPGQRARQAEKKQITSENSAAFYHVLDAQKALVKQLDILYHDACKCESACAYFADVMQTYKDGSLSDDALSVWSYFHDLKRSLACFRGI